MGLLDFLKPKRSQGGCGGGEGQSIETAVVINATSPLIGVAAEYEYVTSRHGQQNAGWSLESQALIQQNGRLYDVLNIKLSSGESRSYYFDITKFYGRF